MVAIDSGLLKGTLLDDNVTPSQAMVSLLHEVVRMARDSKMETNDPVAQSRNNAVVQIISGVLTLMGADSHSDTETTATLGNLKQIISDQLDAHARALDDAKKTVQQEPTLPTITVEDKRLLKLMVDSLYLHLRQIRSEKEALVTANQSPVSSAQTVAEVAPPTSAVPSSAYTHSEKFVQVAIEQASPAELLRRISATKEKLTLEGKS